MSVPTWKLANLQRHLRKGIVYMKKAARFRINQCDTDRHVGQNLFVKLTSRSIRRADSACRR